MFIWTVNDLSIYIFIKKYIGVYFIVCITWYISTLYEEKNFKKIKTTVIAVTDKESREDFLHCLLGEWTEQVVKARFWVVVKVAILTVLVLAEHCLSMAGLTMLSCLDIDLSKYYIKQLLHTLTKKYYCYCCKQNKKQTKQMKIKIDQSSFSVFPTNLLLHSN